MKWDDKQYTVHFIVPTGYHVEHNTTVGEMSGGYYV